MKSLITTGLAAVLLTTLAGTGRAQGPGPGGRPGRRGPGGEGRGDVGESVIERVLQSKEALEKLGVTEEQVQTLKTGLYELKKKKIQQQADIQLAALEQARILSGDSVDEAGLMKAVEKTGGIRTELAKLQMKHILLLQNTLTADQNRQLKEIIHRRMRQMREEGEERFRDRARERQNRERRERGEHESRDPEGRHRGGDAEE